MNDGCHVVGEGADWFGGNEYECSPHFAAHLVRRGMAHIIAAGVPTITHADPIIESRDPVGLDTMDAAPLVRPPSRRTRG